MVCKLCPSWSAFRSLVAFAGDAKRTRFAELLRLDHPVVQGPFGVVASGFEAGGHRIAFLRPAEDSLIGTLSLVPAVVDAVRAPVVAAGGIADGRQVAAAFALGAEAVQMGTAFLATCQSAVSPAYRQVLGHGDRHTHLTAVYTGRLARALAADLDVERIAPFPYQAMLMRPLVAAFWAGQSARLVRPDRDAVELLEQLVAG